MNRNSQWYNILHKINECQKDVEYLQNQKLNISLIEIDIALNKLSLLYDALMAIKLQSASNEENGFLTKNSSLITKIIKDSVFSTEKIEKESEQSESLVSSETNKETTIKDSVHPVETVGMSFELVKEEVNKKEKAEIKENKKAQMTVADSFAKSQKTLADMMEEIHKKKDFATTQQYKSIPDIKRAISINDKIMFIRELFNNNVENYNYVIEQINSCNNLDEALALLDKNVKIESDNVALTTLLELVYRRFLQ